MVGLQILSSNVYNSHVQYWQHFFYLYTVFCKIPTTNCCISGQILSISISFTPAATTQQQNTPKQLKPKRQRKNRTVTKLTGNWSPNQVGIHVHEIRVRILKSSIASLGTISILLKHDSSWRGCRYFCLLLIIWYRLFLLCSDNTHLTGNVSVELNNICYKLSEQLPFTRKWIILMCTWIWLENGTFWYLPRYF